MTRARRHEVSYSVLIPGDEIELYEAGTNPNGTPPPTPRWGGIVEVVDVDIDRTAGQPQVTTKNPRDLYGSPLRSNEGQYTAYRVEGQRRRQR